MTQAVDIRILGKSYTVACPQGEEDNLSRAAEEFAQRIQELKQRSKVGNIEHLAIMVGLNLAYDLQNEKLKSQEYNDAMSQRIKDLQSSIENVLIEQRSQDDID